MSGEALEEAPALPSTNRLKFLCSCGGKILPRPSDGQLKYVGGETRVISVPRSVTFKELSEKISDMFNNSELVIKYQVLPEDLDTLVSVRSDEDLYYLVEEYDRHESLPRSPSSSPRFRIFLFPNTTTMTTPHSNSPTYVDAINNSSSNSNLGKGKNLSISIPTPIKPPIFILSSASACTSPTSTVDSCPLNATTRSNGPGMQRVRSSPNLTVSMSQLGNYNNGNSTTISPKGAIIKNHLQQQQQHKAGMLGHGGGSGGNGGGMNRMCWSHHRCEICGCGCGGVLSGHDHPSARRGYYCPSSAGVPCTCHIGPIEESHAPRSSPHSSFNFSISGTPPVVPRKNVWES